MHIVNSGAGGLWKRILPTRFRRLAALPLPDFYEIMVGYFDSSDKRLIQKSICFCIELSSYFY
jgi:hypothetical protein